MRRESDGDGDAFDGGLDSDLVDLSGVPLDIVAEMSESALIFALRRIRAEAIRGVAAFSTDYERTHPADYEREADPPPAQ
ncbi:hypothetical protein Ssi03_20120 [Sphaerisporangium siamense]|uniref:FXSXX-COOH protein n=1 Tax=Sphaerisporangium siamense TaxID=795645 RepID=A0A7W7DEV0_9ACTN|nr:hypothetical protein [Sphaerisporangium siamense]MBB4705214.1 hypothetical protein [Sphaerisporangium siamense]GII84022.1 hypothetical protein Ssi03_20120 [Sphaerisporangium siamense]